MSARTESIEVDGDTAAVLKERAAARGLSVAQLVAELVSLASDSEAVAELDRRWAAIERGEPTVPHDEVERWIKTWGNPDFRPWNDR